MNPVNPRESEMSKSLTHIDPSADLPESSENEQTEQCGAVEVRVAVLSTSRLDMANRETYNNYG